MEFKNTVSITSLFQKISISIINDDYILKTKLIIQNSNYTFPIDLAPNEFPFGEKLLQYYNSAQYNNLV